MRGASASVGVLSYWLLEPWRMTSGCYAWLAGGAQEGGSHDDTLVAANGAGRGSKGVLSA